jgi:hypothetical protein
LNGNLALANIAVHVMVPPNRFEDGTMRRAFAFIVLALLFTGLACQGTGRRNMRPAEVQIYDLPPSDATWTMNPPEYQKSEGLQPPSPNRDKQANPRGLGGVGGSAPGGMNAGFN